MFVRKLSVALLAGTAMSFAGAAYAADVYSPPVEAAYVPGPEAFSWTGVHFGLGVGGQFNYANVDSDVYSYNYDISHDLDSSSLGKPSWFGTGEVGFDYQMGSVVLGIGANYDFNFNKKWASANSDWYDYTNDLDTYVEHGVKFGDSWAITGRFGFLASPSTFLYGLVGWNNQQVSAYSNYDIDYSTEYDGFSGSKWLSGLVLGAGVETMLAHNLSLKVEYRYAKSGSLSLTDNNDYYGNDNSVSLDNIQSHSVRAVLSWRWGM